MATGRGKKDQQEQTTRNNQSAEAAAAVKPTELETYQSNNTLNFLKDWNSGKDVKDIDALRGNYNLFEGAKNRQSQENLGGGLFNASAGNTSGLAAALKAQNQARQTQDASGQLYNAANIAHSYAEGVLAPSLMNAADNRNQFRAGLFNQRENDFRNRPIRPNPWLGILQSGIQGGATVAAAAI